jgi:hypothetical protein
VINAKILAGLLARVSVSSVISNRFDFHVLILYGIRLPTTRLEDLGWQLT